MAVLPLGTRRPDSEAVTQPLLLAIVIIGTTPSLYSQHSKHTVASEIGFGPERVSRGLRNTVMKHGPAVSYISYQYNSSKYGALREASRSIHGRLLYALTQLAQVLSYSREQNRLPGQKPGNHSRVSCQAPSMANPQYFALSLCHFRHPCSVPDNAACSALPYSPP